MSHQEYRAWADLTGNIATREELAIFKSMDARYISEIAKEDEAIRARESPDG